MNRKTIKIVGLVLATVAIALVAVNIIFLNEPWSIANIFHDGTFNTILDRISFMDKVTGGGGGLP